MALRLYVFFVFTLCIPASISFSQIIFQDNYDNAGDEGWTCNDGVRPGYTGGSACPAANTHNNITHYAGEISAGGRSGNSFKLWRRNGLINVPGWEPGPSYIGYLDKNFTPEEFSRQYKELYVRWYVKIPPQWDATEAHKLNRFYYGNSAGSKTGEWSMIVGRDTFKKGLLVLYNTQSSDVLYSAKTITELGINNGQWHALEWRVKLNTTTGSDDGALQFFVDGEAQDICNYYGENCATEIVGNFGSQTDDYFTTAMPPAIGNHTSGRWDFPTDDWYAFEIDDYAVSTTFIGLGDATIPPLAPKGLIIPNQ